EFRIQFGPLDLENIDLHILVRQLLQFFLDLIHLGTALTDHHTGTCRVDGKRDTLERTLDHHLGDPAFGDTRRHVFTDLVIFDQLVGKRLAAVPVRIPTANDAQAKTYWIDFLSHLFLGFLFFFYRFH